LVIALILTQIKIEKDKPNDNNNSVILHNQNDSIMVSWYHDWFLPKGSYRNVPAKKVPAKKAPETQRFLPKRFLPKKFLEI
jgi:hypothetical protein